jgi:hypothetical protein
VTDYDETIVRRLQELQAGAAKSAYRETTTLDRKTRLSATYSPDARKARDAVRRAFTGLGPLAVEIARITGEMRVKHKIQEAIEKLNDAEEIYAREELRPRPFHIEWAGGVGHGVMPTLPPEAPEHKRDLVAAWNELLRLVNEATRVGVHKPNRDGPIQLIAEVDTIIM